jgi:hypothetical protein
MRSAATRDYTPLQLAAGLDPEQFGGEVLGLDPQPDGLYAVIRATPRADVMLGQDPRLPLSCTIVQDFTSGDGEFFPFSLVSVNAGSAIGLANSDGSPGAYIDLSNGWLGEPGPETSTVASMLGYDDPPQDYDDGSYAALAEYGQAFDLANEAELVRQAEDSVPLPVRSEDRMAWDLDRAARRTLTPQGQFAYGLANGPGYGSTTGEPTCGPVVPGTNYCMNKNHEHGCGSAATPDIVEALRGEMQLKAHRPLLDEDGQPWLDARYGSPMTATDHVEALTGQRQGDVDPYRVRPRRELITAARRAVFGDPDDPDGLPLPVSASTARTAAALARQASITTYASGQAQRDAYRAEHARQAARLGRPRHMDYRTDLSNQAPRETGLTAVGDPPWNGSLQAYTRGAA